MIEKFMTINGTPPEEDTQAPFITDYQQNNTVRFPTTDPCARSL